MSIFASRTLPISTPQAAAAVGVSYSRLVNLMRGGRLTPPLKSASGDYFWWPEDLERAKEALGTATEPAPAAK